MNRDRFFLPSWYKRQFVNIYDQDKEFCHYKDDDFDFKFGLLSDRVDSKHFVKALKKILDEIFVWASPIKHMERSREKLYTDLFGNPKGEINSLPNEIKILSHGFDPKESFRKRKKEKTWKKKKKMVCSTQNDI
jgi:hypothetical protein